MKKHYTTATVGQGNVEWQRGQQAEIREAICKRFDPMTCDLSPLPRQTLMRVVLDLRERVRRSREISATPLGGLACD